MDAWLATGRVVFFGLSGLVHNFSQEQLRGVRSIPLGRHLVESDSPHLRVSRGEMTPGQTGVTYRRVSGVLGVGLPALAQKVREDLYTLFRQQLRGNPAQ